MELGLNLSFAVKRWTTPQSLGSLCGEMNELGVRRFQFSLDQLDPWWPAAERGAVAARYRQEFEDRSLVIDSAFGGMAAYTFPNLLAPLEEQRRCGLELFKRSLDVTRELGATTYGSPLGGMDTEEARDPELRRVRYAQAVEAYLELADHAASVGITSLMVEPTPVGKELLTSPEDCLRFADDVSGAAVPVTFLVDWGHAVCEPYGDAGSMTQWMTALGAHVGGIHLQQTDGKADRHWAFDREGIVSNALIRQVAEDSGTEHLVQFLEYMPLFESDDRATKQAVVTSVEHLRGAFGG